MAARDDLHVMSSIQWVCYCCEVHESLSPPMRKSAWNDLYGAGTGEAPFSPLKGPQSPSPITYHRASCKQGGRVTMARPEKGNHYR